MKENLKWVMIGVVVMILLIAIPITSKVVLTPAVFLRGIINGIAGMWKGDSYNPKEEDIGEEI